MLEFKTCIKEILKKKNRFFGSLLLGMNYNEIERVLKIFILIHDSGGSIWFYGRDTNTNFSNFINKDTKNHVFVNSDMKDNNVVFNFDSSVANVFCKNLKKNLFLESLGKKVFKKPDLLVVVDPFGDFQKEDNFLFVNKRKIRRVPVVYFGNGGEGSLGPDFFFKHDLKLVFLFFGIFKKIVS
jgi:hypothetical protein